LLDRLGPPVISSRRAALDLGRAPLCGRELRPGDPKRPPLLFLVVVGDVHEAPARGRAAVARQELVAVEAVVVRQLVPRGDVPLCDNREVRGRGDENNLGVSGPCVTCVLLSAIHAQDGDRLDLDIVQRACLGENDDVVHQYSGRLVADGDGPRVTVGVARVVQQMGHVAGPGGVNAELLVEPEQGASQTHEGVTLSMNKGEDFCQLSLKSFISS